jgi:hypothetical protein
VTTVQLVINDFEIYGMMIEGVEQVSGYIALYEIIERRYLQRATAFKVQLESSIARLYATILQFLGKASRFYSHNTGARFMKSVVENADKTLSPFLTAMVRQDRDVKDVLALLDAEDAKSTAVQIQSTVDQVTNSLHNVDSKLDQFSSAQRGEYNALGAGNQKIQRKLSELYDQVDYPMLRLVRYLDQQNDNLEKEKRLAILRWLSKIPYAKHHRNINRDILPDSGEWLLREESYKYWKVSSTSSILWLHGIPGCGKSKLISKVILQHLQEKEQHPSAAPVAYFYCARVRAEPERGNPAEILSAVLRQLLANSTSASLPPWIIQEYNKRLEEAEDDESNIEALRSDETFQFILDVTETVPITIILDALDECDPNKRHELLQSIHNIVHDSSNVVKILVSSRDDGDIVLNLSDVPNIHIKASSNADDIARFADISIDTAITERRLLGGQISQGHQSQIKTYLKRKAQGM